MAGPSAAEPFDMDESEALRIVGKYPDTLKGRLVGVLVTDGAGGALVQTIRAAAKVAGAQVQIIAPKVGGVVLKDGKTLKADRQLAGAPSVLFDAVALVLSENGCALLLKAGAAVDFAKDASGHLKAIGYTHEAQPLLDKAGVVPDAGVIDLAADGSDAFIAPASTRQWAGEPDVRILS